MFGLAKRVGWVVFVDWADLLVKAEESDPQELEAARLAVDE